MYIVYFIEFHFKVSPVSPVSQVQNDCFCNLFITIYIHRKCLLVYTREMIASYVRKVIAVLGTALNK